MSAKGYKGRPGQATLENIAFPEKIKCNDCNKNLMAARYSNNQLKKYQESIYKKGMFNAERPRCQRCMGTAGGTNLWCNDCNLDKSKEEFSKVARRNPDNAVCCECQQRILDQEANVDDAMKEAEIEEDYHRKGSSVFNLGDMGSSLPSASKQSSHNTPSEAGTDDSGKVLITEPLSTSGRTSATRGRTQQDTNKESFRRRSSSQESSATMSTARSTATMTSNGTRVAGSNASRAEDKWHKQNAVKKSAEEKVMDAIIRSNGKTKHEQLQRDSDSDESDYEM